MLTFQEALDDSRSQSKQHVLLGNGFSIACRPDIFVYGKLFERADFSRLSESARLAFDALNTQDFELVIKALRNAKELIRLYEGSAPSVAELMQQDADGLKEVLVQTIASSHPDWPGELNGQEYTACRSFLANFNTVYTLNYDLLLYWTQMHVEEGISPQSDDGFRTPEDNFEARYVTWESSQSHSQNTWFLHGALHIFDSGTEVQKYTWRNTQVRLIDQIRDALQRDLYPLFVAEGSSDEKLERIRHSDYLAKAYRSFAEIGGALFIYGHSLAENDEHFLQLIERGKIRKLYIGIYGAPTAEPNRTIMNRASRMAVARAQYPRKPSLEVKFFDSGTAHVWDSQLPRT